MYFRLFLVEIKFETLFILSVARLVEMEFLMLFFFQLVGLIRFFTWIFAYYNHVLAGIRWQFHPNLII